MCLVSVLCRSTMSFFGWQQHCSLRLVFFLLIVGFWEPSGWTLVNVNASAGIGYIVKLITDPIGKSAKYHRVVYKSKFRVSSWRVHEQLGKFGEQQAERHSTD